MSLNSEDRHIFSLKGLHTCYLSWFNFFTSQNPAIFNIDVELSTITHLFNHWNVTVMYEQYIFLLVTRQPVPEPANRCGKAVAERSWRSAGKRWKTGEGVGFSDRGLRHLRALASHFKHHREELLVLGKRTCT